MSDKKKSYDLLDFTNQAKFFIEKYFKLGLILSLIAIACSAAWVGMKKIESKKEQESFDKLFAITNEYNKRKDNFDEAKEKDKKKDPKTTEKLEKATGDLEKDYGDLIQKLKSFLSSNKGLQASGEAALTLSEIYENHDKKEKAAEVLNSTLQAWKGTGLLAEIMRMRAGDLWSMNNQCDRAVRFWEELANKDSFLSTQAQLKLGLCYQKMGKTDQAKMWLQRITSKKAESPAGFSAKKYLRYLDFEKNFKKEANDKTAEEKDKGSEKSS